MVWMACNTHRPNQWSVFCDYTLDLAAAPFPFENLSFGACAWLLGQSILHWMSACMSDNFFLTKMTSSLFFGSCLCGMRLWGNISARFILYIVGTYPFWFTGNFVLLGGSQSLALSPGELCFLAMGELWLWPISVHMSFILHKNRPLYALSDMAELFCGLLPLAQLQAEAMTHLQGSHQDTLEAQVQVLLLGCSKWVL